MSGRSITYRVCCFERAQRILNAELIQAQDDDEAIEKAEALGFSQCELWEGRRLVAVLGDEQRRAAALTSAPSHVEISPLSAGTSAA